MDLSNYRGYIGGTVKVLAILKVNMNYDQTDFDDLQMTITKNEE
jgi:hypothetical protein